MLNTPLNHQNLITYHDPSSPLAEAYRQLRTNIQFASLDKSIKTILVTSAGPDEGKSTTLANLAITLAQAGHSVILMDCDLRRPSLHQLFGLDNTSGLTNFILDTDASVASALKESGVDNLRLLLSGPSLAAPWELLGSQRMVEVLEQLKAQADYILLDSPPVVAVTDAVVLATRVDGVLLVLRAGKTKREMAQRAKAMLDRVNANILGVILNNAKYASSVHSYYVPYGKP